LTFVVKAGYVRSITVVFPKKCFLRWPEIRFWWSTRFDWRLTGGGWNAGRVR